MSAVFFLLENQLSHVAGNDPFTCVLFVTERLWLHDLDVRVLIFRFCNCASVLGLLHPFSSGAISEKRQKPRVISMYVETLMSTVGHNTLLSHPHNTALGLLDS